MKRGFIALLVGSALWSSSAMADQCFKDRRVVAVNAGYVDIGRSAAPDGGDAVFFSLDDGQGFPLNAAYNLDWPRGQALHRMLVAAMAARWRVTGYDHYGTRCDDIDEIHIEP